jgi:hypothetical protein
VEVRRPGQAFAVISTPAAVASAEYRPSAGPRASVTLFLVVATALSVLVALGVALPDYLPTNDGPEHVFASHAARHLDDPALGYGRYLKLGSSFSQIGFDRLFSTWETLLSWRSALRASLATMVLVWAWGVVALAVALGGRRFWLGLFGFAGAVQWVLYMGFFSFYLSTGLGFSVLALALWRPDFTRRWRVVLGAALMCQALVHPIPAIVTGLAIVIARAWHVPRRGLGRELGLLMLMGAPAALVALASAGPQATGDETGYLPLADHLGLAIRAFTSGPAWRVWTPPLCAVGAAALIAGQRTWRKDARCGALFSLGVLLALVAIFAPDNLAGWQFFNMRFTPTASIVLVVLIPYERWSRRLRIASLLALIGFAAASNLWALGYNLRLRAASAELLAGLDVPIRRSGLRLPIILEPRAGEPQAKMERTIPHGTANWNVGSLYAVAQGGVPAWSFTDLAQLHHVVWRWPERQGLRPPRPERGFEWSLSEPVVVAHPERRQAEINYLLSYAPAYEDVIFYGRPEEVRWLHERHFTIDYEKGGLAIARFHACPATLELAAGPSGHSATLLAYGWAPSRETTLADTLPTAPGAVAARPWHVGTSPCGEIWFRVLFDNDGNGRLSPGDTTCLEANAQGVLGARMVEGGGVVPCHPGRPLSPS